MTSQQDRFQELLEEHRKILFKVANAYTREASDREDLVQEMVLQLWRSFARYDERQRECAEDAIPKWLRRSGIASSTPPPYDAWTPRLPCRRIG